jgi:predicted phosphate transport protein (TIGR00153 family)
VRAQADDWPERDERESRWFDLPEAAAAVDEPELKRLIAGFRATPTGPAATDGAAMGAKRGLQMLGWFQSLMPKQGRFFDLFEAHARTLVAGAEALSNLLGEEGRNDECIAEIIRQEHAADDITRDVLLDVRRVFVTPFDRSAITDLIGVMDDAIDQMNATAKSIRLFELTRFDSQMRDMAALIVEASRLTAELMPLLRDINGNATRLHELTERLIRLEGDADEIHEAGLKGLFQAHGQDRPMAFIVGQEVFSHLERVVDKFEDIANEVQGLVIDHA